MANRLQDPNASSTFGNSLLLRVDGAIGAMSLSPNGRDAVLAGRRGLFIIDLDDPFTPPRWLHHITSWEVADVQWSPHHFVKPSWCISTSNQKALLWDLKRPSSNAIANILHSHNRAISDINFHPFDPEILATCAIDTFVMCWDMRTPRKPVSKWAEWRAGAIQVKWNHENPYEIALSHDNSFYVWDTRKGALPVVKIENAHAKKINGIDFNQGLKNIITCSNDGTVKFWDLKSEAASKFIEEFNYFDSKPEELPQPSVVLETNFPIARARTLPFGSDKACGIMPLKGGDNAIHLVNYDDAYQEYLNTKQPQRITANSVYSFKGHRGPMKDFLWRTRHENYEGFESKRMWKDYQLVTWSSQDYDLKLWPHDREIYKGVNYDPTFYNVFKDELESEVSRPQTPSAERYYNYETYCCEPDITIDDITKTNGGDLISAMTLSLIAEKHKRSTDEFMQLNHLNWISGVRMGHAGHGDGKQNESTLEDDGPCNLGEEVSIVGHKFPKIRFEKISVSTGELVISLKGPVPSGQGTSMERSNSTDTTENNAAESAISVRDKSIVSEPDRETEKMSYKDGSIKNENVDDSTKDDLAIEQKLVFIRLEVDFPSAYPYLESVDVNKNMSPKRLAKWQKQNLVKFSVEETHELSKPIRETMEGNLNDIAQFYANKYQRFCLEPCLRYLMGEKIELDDEEIIREDRRDINDNGEEEFIQEAGDEAWVDDLINQQPDIPTYSSGEEDDERDRSLIPAISNSTLNKIEEVGTHLTVASAEAQMPTSVPPHKPSFVDSTPLPNGCGAIWSPTGQLVCFFIPKTKSDNASGEFDEETDDNENNRKGLQKFNIFQFTDGGLGAKTHSNHHHHHRKSNSIVSDAAINGDETYDENVDGNGSASENLSGDDIDDTSSSSSNDSFAEDWDEMLLNDAPRRRVQGLFKTSIGFGNRFTGNDSSHRSSLNRFTSNGGTGSNYKSSMKGELKKKVLPDDERKNKNIVGIFDFSHLLPDKYELAREYRVLGDTPEVLVSHNSKVALKYGLKEISDVWKILEMVLMKNIQFTDNSGAYIPSCPLRTPLDSHFGTQMINRTAFYWDDHPFGGTWFVKEIFNYFEKKQNVQMLAMMSCILYENPENLKTASESMNVPVHTPYQALPQPPTVLQQTARNSTMFGFMSQPLSSEDARYDLRNSSVLSTRKESQHSGMAYAKSICSSIDTESVINGSPDKFRYLKKNFSSRGYPGAENSNNSYSSLSESLIESNISTPERTTRMLLEKPGKSILKQQPFTWRRSRLKPAPVVTIEMQNVEELDLFESVNSRALLDAIDDDKLVRYRELYAEMLYNWRLPIGRVKILKFNHPELEHTEVSTNDIHKCRIGLRKKSRQQPNQNYVNSVSTIVSDHPNAWNTSKRQSLKYCNLCKLVVTKNFTLCTVCEHLMHTDCAGEWWSTGNDECASGCGCKCLERSI
ncbi:Maintenance of telomere capping protein 5 [Candida viswanathii]|uniref:Maintenance of telomere capping protein 5 n=1 Tax=Candida viswanathii TaxID=5486 RepID=A0A367YK00_9ASCO|nr:Maintenance of telomere capping protein 5 [Candida viswanathii]